jgi:hypothetical protein
MGVLMDLAYLEARAEKARAALLLAVVEELQATGDPLHKEISETVSVEYDTVDTDAFVWLEIPKEVGNRLKDSPGGCKNTSSLFIGSRIEILDRPGTRIYDLKYHAEVCLHDLLMFLMKS